MIDHSIVKRIDQNDPRAVAAAQAEQRLFEHYGLDYRVHYIQLKDPSVCVRVVEVGAGEPLLFVPGGTGEGWAFAGIMAELKGWRMISITMPGGGLSDSVAWGRANIRRLFPAVVLAVMDSFELEQVPVISNSMGGCTTLWVTLEHPERVSKIVQLGCTAWIPAMTPPLFLRLLAVPGLNRMVASGMRPKSIQAAAKGLKFQGSRPEDIQSMDAPGIEAAYYFFQLPTYTETWRGLVTSLSRFGNPKQEIALKVKELKGITQPVLYLWGDNDPFGSLEVARNVVRLFPNARLHEMRAGHLPFLDDPVQCGRVIAEFLAPK